MSAAEMQDGLPTAATGKSPFRRARWLVLLGLAAGLVPTVVSARPYTNGTFQGRIAWSADGNHNDPDDWIASPLALAVFAEMGLRDRVVHFDYNCILPQTNEEWEKIHADSVLGAVKQWGYDDSRFVDVRKDRERAIDSIARAINASSKNNPLYFVVAGPMEIPVLGIRKSDPAKRRFVYCISHSRWNEGYSASYTFTFTKRSVIEEGVNWIQVPDQNRLLAFGRFGMKSPPEEFAPYFWLRDATDPKLKFLWERMVVSTRPDPSDAGMAWFLVTGDEEGTPEKFRQLLVERRRPKIVTQRPKVRIEAENFRFFDGYELQHRNRDREASHRISVARPQPNRSARIRTRLDELYMAPRGRYDIEVRYMDRPDDMGRFTLMVNGVEQSAPWVGHGTEGGWTTHTIRDVAIAEGDELRVEGEYGIARLDYVELSLRSATAAPTRSGAAAAASSSGGAGTLDDPAAMPGGLIVAGPHPGYLKLNGGPAVFLSGPDDPETFLYLGELQPDGTRKGGKQDEIIQRLAKNGVTAFHCQIFRMQRCNFKNEGDDSHSPFVDHDPSKPLNPNVLDQWDGWIAQLERAGIILHFEFYNDATDVHMIGWKLDAQGNLHPDEHRFVTGIVERFKHRKNILWGLEESANKLPRDRTPQFKKMAQVIAETDNYNHPIVQSLVITDDPEGDAFTGMATSDDYEGDPHIRVVTWLHLIPHGDDVDMYHATLLRYTRIDGRRFIVMKNETFYRRYLVQHPLSRQYMWAAAMAGMHTLEAQHKAERPTHSHLFEADGHLARFMNGTDFHLMRNDNTLAHGPAKWVLANPAGRSFIAYSSAANDPMGVKALPAGEYDLWWFDAEKGTEAEQNNVTVIGGDVTWPKPGGMGAEVAVYIRPSGSHLQKIE